MSIGESQPLPHAYTNLVAAREQLVTKTYRGADGVERQQREALAIHSLTGILPVATIVESHPRVIVLEKVPGRHGQDLIAMGEGQAVMFCLGRLLREVQAVTPAFYGEFNGTGVLVHGDFGPNNLLLAEDGDVAVLLADWEWSTVGGPITDLAWAEFILRMHHLSIWGVCAHCSTVTVNAQDGTTGRPPWRTERHLSRHGFAPGRVPRRRRAGTTGPDASRSG